MKRKIIAILTVILICTTCITYAVPPDALKGFFPDTKKITSDATVKNEFSEYPWYNYCFDVEKGKGFIDISAGLNQIPNAIFMLLVLLTKFSIFILVSCYKVNIYEIAPASINALVNAINSGVFKGFTSVVAAMAGLYGLWKTYQGNKTSGWKAAISSIIVMGLSVYFFANPSGLATGLNKASDIISTEVLRQTISAGQTSQRSGTQVVTNSSDAVILIGNLFWDVCVKKPWELIEYGSIGDVANPDDILKLDVGSPEREELTAAYAQDNPFFRGENFGARLALTLIMLLLGLVYNICILLIACTVIWNHLCSLFWLCFAGVFFLAALYPRNGLKVLGNWALETFGFMINKIIITIALSIYFALALKVYTWTDKYGYAIVIGLNIVLLVIAIVKHKKVYEILLGLFTADQSVVNKGMQKESLGSKVSHGIMTAYAGQRLYNGMKTRMEKNKENNYLKKNRDKAEDVLTNRYNNEKQAARRGAEGALYERYNKEKQQADERAQRTGRPPEYSRFVHEADKRKENGERMFTEEQIQENLRESDFVKQVEDRRKRGYTLFSEDQVRSTASQMYKLKQEGNDPDRLLVTDVENKDGGMIQEDQEHKDHTIAATRNKLEGQRTENNQKIEDYIESQPGKHFKPGAFVNAKARENMRKLFNPAELKIQAADAYFGEQKPVQYDAEGFEGEDDVIYVHDKLRLDAADEGAAVATDDIEQVPRTEGIKPLEEGQPIVNETSEISRVVNHHNAQRVIEDIESEDQIHKESREIRQHHQLGEDISEVQESNTNRRLENISSSNTDEYERISENSNIQNLREINTNEHTTITKTEKSTEEELRRIEKEKFDREVAEMIERFEREELLKQQKINTQTVNSTMENIRTVNAETVDRQVENVSSTIIAETNAEAHRSNIHSTNETIENIATHDTKVTNEDIRNISEVNRTVENRHADNIEEQHFTSNNFLKQDIKESFTTEVNVQASEAQKPVQAIGFGEVALFSQMLDKDKKKGSADEKMKEMLKKMSPQGISGQGKEGE